MIDHRKIIPAFPRNKKYSYSGIECLPWDNMRSRFSLKYWMSLILQQFPSEALCFVLKESISDIIFQNKGKYLECLPCLPGPGCWKSYCSANDYLTVFGGKPENSQELDLNSKLYNKLYWPEASETRGARGLVPTRDKAARALSLQDPEI